MSVFLREPGGGRVDTRQECGDIGPLATPFPVLVVAGTSISEGLRVLPPSVEVEGAMLANDTFSRRDWDEQKLSSSCRGSEDCHHPGREKRGIRLLRRRVAKEGTPDAIHKEKS